MIIIPAIDIKDGKCVRLLQGRPDEVTVYSDDPVSMARHWEEMGAEMIHVVDLDGAFTGAQLNFGAIREISRSVNIPLEVGGGIRDMYRMKELVSIGVDRIILGTSAAQNPDMLKEACREFPGKVFVGVDAKDGKVAISGWVEVTDFPAIDFAKKAEDAGSAGIIYTDISRDGMLTGPNLQAMESMVHALGIPVIASGGVSGLPDIRNLAKIKGLWGVITGKALYAGTLDLAEALSVVG